MQSNFHEFIRSFMNKINFVFYLRKLDENIFYKYIFIHTEINLLL
jgi:hypothetical protein